MRGADYEGKSATGYSADLWLGHTCHALTAAAVCHIMAFLHGNGMILLLSSKSKFVWEWA